MTAHSVGSQRCRREMIFFTLLIVLKKTGKELPAQRYNKQQEEDNGQTVSVQKTFFLYWCSIKTSAS